LTAAASFGDFLLLLYEVAVFSHIVVSTGCSHFKRQQTYTACSVGLKWLGW